MMRKILVISSPFPFPPKGANAQDRASGILQYIRLGFEVKLITSIIKSDDDERLKNISRELGIEIIPFMEPTGEAGPIAKRVMRLAIRLTKNPLMLDGSAGNFDNPALKAALDYQMRNWRPDAVWFERSYTWPLYKILKKYNAPIITRSHNFEPIDFLRSHGNKPQSYPTFLAKSISEILTVRGSNIIFALSPQEEQLYRKIGAKNVVILPLRNLPGCLGKGRGRARMPDNILNAFFTGSTYKVPRNKKTLEFVLKEVVPRVEKIAPDSFRFHIFGDKLPAEFRTYLGENVIYRGYVEDLDTALEEMDIALGNNLTIAGMQGKIFEPLARGFPLITSPKGLAGWPFENEKHVLLAETADEFAQQLARLKNQALRECIATGARIRSQELFSERILDAIILENIASAITHTLKNTVKSSASYVF